MKKLLGVVVAASLVAAIPAASAQTPPYKIPPGQYCKGLSKKKIEGQKKTPFAQCVTAMAKLNKKPSLAPSQVCAGIKTKAKGKAAKKTANAQFKKCVQAGKKLKLDKANS